MPEPWTEVLDYACVWAANKSSESSAVRAITLKAYTSFGKHYYGDATHAQGTTFELTDFFQDSWADCRDMSATVQVFTRAIGGDSTYFMYIDMKYGQYDGMDTKAILLIGGSSWITTEFDFHQVAYKSGVYDACLKLREDVGVNERVPRGEGLNVPYKRDLYDSGGWLPDEGDGSYTTIE